MAEVKRVHGPAYAEGHFDHGHTVDDCIHDQWLTSPWATEYIRACRLFEQAMLWSWKSWKR